MRRCVPRGQLRGLFAQHALCLHAPKPHCAGPVAASTGRARQTLPRSAFNRVFCRDSQGAWPEWARAAVGYLVLQETGGFIAAQSEDLSSQTSHRAPAAPRRGCRGATAPAKLLARHSWGCAPLRNPVQLPWRAPPLRHAAPRACRRARAQGRSARCRRPWRSQLLCQLLGWRCSINHSGDNTAGAVSSSRTSCNLQVVWTATGGVTPDPTTAPRRLHTSCSGNFESPRGFQLLRGTQCE